MTTTTEAALSQASLQVHEHELALHIAHQTGVDAWISAASDRLHAALGEFDAVCRVVEAEHARP